MKPLNLIMQAFGPYKDRVEIPFEKLGNSNLYLIYGVTGSGKTTVFDAITYALFNSSSGQNRENDTLRSHFAKDETESFVEFEFLHNGQKYTILRHPPYERKKLKGEGTIPEQAKAQITLPDGKIITKVKEVDEYIQNLLGLNAAQFSQIALLAQGEFLKLLNADTKTRSAIFRNIFKTKDFCDFQDKLKDTSSFYKNSYESLKSSILQYISDAIPNREELKILKENYIKNAHFYDLEEFIKLLDEQNKADNRALLGIKKEVEDKEEKIKSLQNEFLKIQNKISLQEQKAKIEAEILLIEKEFKIIQKDFENLPQKKEELQNLSLEIKNASEDYKKSSEIKQMQAQKEKLESLLTNQKDKLEKTYIDFFTLKLNHLKASYSAILDCEENYKNKQKEFLELEKEAKNLNEEYLKNYNAYLRIQAGILAKTLEENEPCPVCGSIEHPNPAKLVNKELTKDFIDSLKNKADRANEKLSGCAQDSSVLKERLDGLNEAFLALEKKYGAKIEKKKYDVLNLDFENELSNYQNQIDNQARDMVTTESDIKALNATIERLLKDIKFSDTNDILTRHQNLSKKFEKLKKEIQEIEDIFNKTKYNLDSLKSKAELLLGQLSQYDNEKEINLEKINEEIEKFKFELLKLNKDTQNILIQKTINEKALESIKDKNKEWTRVSKLYTDYKILSDCANGNLKGSIRVTFEQYIQGYYLDMVLFEANKRLKIMTQNQFQLIRKKDVTSLQGKTGLDLEVMDFHTFKKRSTKTLSGGESFKAALALALGLSDCMSNMTGAMDIDAMFIDEGFGSLDSESLELAMDVIFDLSGNNRLVGIISHVEDLKSKIQNRILTTKTDYGSLLSVEF